MVQYGGPEKLKTGDAKVVHFFCSLTVFLSLDPLFSYSGGSERKREKRHSTGYFQSAPLSYLSRNEMVQHVGWVQVGDEHM